MFFQKFFRQPEPENNKPPESQIVLINNYSDFQIILPSNGLNVKTILFFLSLVGLWIYLAYKIYSFSSSELIFSTYLIDFPLYFFSFVFIAAFFLEILFSRFGHTRLIDKNKFIFLNYELFGVTFFSVCLFSQLQVTELVTNYYQTTAREVATITIWAGKKKYQMGRSGGILDFCRFRLTKLEMYWLASALSDRFNLPILEEFWSMRNKGKSLEYMRVIWMWFFPLICLTSYFLIAVGTIGIIANFSDTKQIFLSNDAVALYFGLFLAIVALKYFRNLTQSNVIAKQKDLEAIFFRLLEEGEGEVSLIGFKREAGLSSQEASEYLKGKVETLNGVCIKRSHNMYYYFRY